MDAVLVSVLAVVLPLGDEDVAPVVLVVDAVTVSDGEVEVGVDGAVPTIFAQTPPLEDPPLGLVIGPH